MPTIDLTDDEHPPPKTALPKFIATSGMGRAKSPCSPGSLTPVQPMKDDFLAVGIDLDHPASDTKAKTDAEAITSFEALLRTESAKTAQAIAAFESLARLEAMAEARRPWWRRLTG
jgi:hypothetical protein